MKYIILLLSLVWLSKAEQDPTGGVSVEKKLKMQKSVIGESYRSWRLNDRSSDFFTITDLNPTGNCIIKVEENDVVTFEAYGYLMDGRRFDTGIYEGKIGNDETPKGVNEGLKGLCIGDERSMRIQSEWAYGEEGLHDKVPENATVIYDIKVINIERDNDLRTGLKMNEMLKITDTNIVEDCMMTVQGGDKIDWHYIGKLTNQTVFDTGEFTAKIDNRDVIQGVNEAMKGLCVGGERTMLMHHSYGYGTRGSGNIPGYANLIFEVHLHSIDRPGVGWESQVAKLRKASVSKDNPIKITDTLTNGVCKILSRNGDIITWFYHGYLLDGTIFDKGQSEVKLGDKETTPVGLKKGLKGLCVGDTRSITLHPDLAYGTTGMNGKVPSNATVIYDVNILNIARTISPDEATGDGVDINTGMKPNQKLKIEIIKSVDYCTMKSQTDDTITWNYRGTFLDGTEFYNGTFKAVLGRNQIILGVDRGMRDMCIGEKRQLTVHSDWAYGNDGRPGSIPPRATLVFDNELTNIERPVKEKKPKTEL